MDEAVECFPGSDEAAEQFPALSGATEYFPGTDEAAEYSLASSGAAEYFLASDGAADVGSVAATVDVSAMPRRAPSIFPTLVPAFSALATHMQQST